MPGSYLATAGNSIGLEIKSADGPYVTASGRRYIDFTSGWCVGNLGWNNKVATKAIRSYSGPDYVSPSFDYRPWNDLAELLCTMAPGNFSKCFRCTGGSEAVDLALKIAMISTGRKKFVSLGEAYHGNTIAGASIGGESEKKDLTNLLTGCSQLTGPFDSKALRKAETALKKKDVAAFIMEPDPINPGVELPEADFVKGVKRLCKKYGTLFIADEVATGFGRTGKLFASEHFDLEPDIMCIAKAMSGGYGGIGAVLVNKSVYKSAGEISHYSTYGWHPLAVQASLAVLRYYRDNLDGLMKNVEDRSQQARTALSQMPFRKGGKLSIIGLAVAADVGDEAYAARVTKRCRENGLLITTSGTRLVMFPPLNVKKEVVSKAMKIVSASCR